MKQVISVYWNTFWFFIRISPRRDNKTRVEMFQDE